MQSPLIHMICGSTGAGKTTYALKLAADISGVIFSIDQWMATLFWMDTPQPLIAAWTIERVECCMAQVWETGSQVAARGVQCVFDLSFAQAASRARFADLAKTRGFPVRLHFLDLPTDERWRRVQSRNRDIGPANQLPFDVTREMFDLVEGMFEPPTDVEMHQWNGIRISA